LETGEQNWESEFSAWLRGFATESGLLMLGAGKNSLRTIGYRVETGETIWELPETLNCAPLFPIADDGTFACLDIASRSVQLYGS
jgi:hypothetical protein